MSTLIITLLIAGIIAGMVQYFVDYKQLGTYEPPVAGFDGSRPGLFTRVLAFLKTYWRLVGYTTLGIAGAFLTPLINEMTPLNGLKEIKACLLDPKGTCQIASWYILVLFGYGIVLGYASVRLLRNISGILLGNLSKEQETLKASLQKALKEIETLKAKNPPPPPGPKPAQWDAADDPDGNLSPNGGDDEAARLEIAAVNGFAFTPCAENPRPWDDKPWRVAECLRSLVKKVNTLAPERSKRSDGSIGDMAHQSRTSDHNPWVLDGDKGVVTAVDITHDPEHNCDCHTLARSLEENKDPRIKYVIWNKRIINASPINGHPAWTWRPYKGSNPHNKHIHISTHCDKALYDAADEWEINI